MDEKRPILPKDFSILKWFKIFELSNKSFLESDALSIFDSWESLESQDL